MRAIRLLKRVQNSHGDIPKGAVVQWSEADMQSLVDARKAEWVEDLVHLVEDVARVVRRVTKIVKRKHHAPKPEEG